MSGWEIVAALVMFAYIGTICVAAVYASECEDGDTPADRAIRQRVADNRAKRESRVQCNVPSSDDEHESHLGI